MTWPYPPILTLFLPSVPKKLEPVPDIATPFTV